MREHHCDNCRPVPNSLRLIHTYHLDDLEAAARRLEHLTSDDRWHHPSTPRAVRIAVDDIVDTIARMWEG